MPGDERARLNRLGGAAVVLTLTLALIACAAGPARLGAETQGLAPAAPTAEEALRRHVEGEGGAYASDCAATRSPRDLGKVCSRFIAERDGLRAYLIGRTFSEFSTWVFVEQTSAGWRVAATAPLDFFSQSLDVPWPR
jgi:hypothetical protein